MTSVRVIVATPVDAERAPLNCPAHMIAAGRTTPEAPYVIGRLALQDEHGAYVCPACILPRLRDCTAELADVERVRELLNGAHTHEEQLLRALLQAQEDAGRERVEWLRISLRAVLGRGGSGRDEVSSLLRELLDRDVSPSQAPKAGAARPRAPRG